MPSDSRRLSILTVREIDDLYGLPRFTQEDRQLYFDMSAAERELANGIHTASVEAHFILQLGYFKAKRQFFVYPCDAVVDDFQHIRQRYFPGRDWDTVKALSKPTRIEQQQTILNLFDYTRCDSVTKQELERKAQRIAMRSTQPIYIFREAFHYLETHRIVAPGYTFMQDMVGRVVTGERKRITQRLGQALTPAVDELLQALLQPDEGPYRLAVLKHEPKDFSHKELRQEVERRKFFQPLHDFTQTFLLSASLSSESVKYYASLVEFYTVYKLNRMAVPATRLYLLCFAYHRFRQINDNLIEAFIHLVDGYERDAKLAAKEAVYQAKTTAIANLKAAGQVLDLLVDGSIPTDTPFGAVQEKAFSLLGPEHFPGISRYMSDAEFDETGFEWACCATLSRAFKLNLRHLVTDLEFAGRVEDAPLLKAVSFLQAARRQGKSPRQ
jgi:hypothetical protein